MDREEYKAEILERSEQFCEKVKFGQLLFKGGEITKDSLSPEIIDEFFNYICGLSELCGHYNLYNEMFEDNEMVDKEKEFVGMKEKVKYSLSKLIKEGLKL